ncbi:hypothetical protein DL96DRAFT_1612699 [Flagelloscypha sp. PMI_526]|nr:hypothetical protein DL96DRAFT_1612699 [Flagelloscypha sp. PMI_526]
MASISAPVPFALSYDPEEADDQDVDQLACSDDEMDQDDDSPLPTPRNPGESYLPSERLETIIQADGTTGQIPLTKEGLFLLSIATEEFIKRFALAGKQRASDDQRSSIGYMDISSPVQTQKEFKFLKDIVPAPISIKEALALREKKLTSDILDDDTPLSLPRSAMPPIVNPGFTSAITGQAIPPPGFHYQVPPHVLAAALQPLPTPPPGSQQFSSTPSGTQQGVAPPHGGTKMGRLQMNGQGKTTGSFAQGNPYPSGTGVLPLTTSSSASPAPNTTTATRLPQESPPLPTSSDDSMDTSTHHTAPISTTPTFPIEQFNATERKTLESLAIQLRAAAATGEEHGSRSISAAPAQSAVSASPPPATNSEASATTEQSS